MTKEKAIIALDNIAKGFQDLNEIISPDSMANNDLFNFMNVVPDYPFAKSFDDIDVQTWVNKAKAYINSLREPIIPQNQENKMVKKKMFESKKEKFENFLESLKGSGKDSLIESIKKGFDACYESLRYDEDNPHYPPNSPSATGEYDALPGERSRVSPYTHVPNSITDPYSIPEEDDEGELYFDEDKAIDELDSDEQGFDEKWKFDKPIPLQRVRKRVATELQP